MTLRAVHQTFSAERWTTLAILVAGALAIWAGPFLTVVPHDYLDFLLPWYVHIRAAGVVRAFAHPFSNYTPPYLYLLAASTLLPAPPLIAIKLVSVTGSAWASYSVFRLLKVAGAMKPVEGSLAILLLPTVTFNVPILAQADLFWVAPCLLAIAAAYKTDTAAMMLWAGLGFAFKAQAIFIAPFVVAVLIARRAPAWHWLIPPTVYLVAVLPAWVAGWPASDLLTVYLKQARYVPPNGVRVISNASNWWALFGLVDYREALRSFWVGFAAATIASLLYLRRGRSIGPDYLLPATVSAIMLPFFLPGMHERFYALGELAIFCLSWTTRSRVTSVCAFLMQAQLVLAFFGWILRWPALTVGGAAFVTAVLFLLLRQWSADYRSRQWMTSTQSTGNRDEPHWGTT